MRDVVEVLRAAGETTRLRLLALLAEGEHSVKDLTEILGQSQPRVSRHLKLLADAGLVERNAEGAWAYYGLASSGPGAELARWLTTRIDPGDPEREGDRQRLLQLRDAHAQAAAAYFAEVAASWDQVRALHVPEAAVEMAILDIVESRRVDLLFDLGTGTGRMLELLADRYRRGVGIDSSRDMIAVARSRLKAAGISHAQVRLADIGALDPSLGRADLIIIHQVLHYFDDPGRLIHGIRPVLAPGGSMVIVDFAPHDLEHLRTDFAHRRLGLSDAQMASWAQSARLVIAASRTIPAEDAEGGLTVCIWRLADSATREGEHHA
jgi:DNA-binding transcriptional ArsR family regulator/2-polyprenyl-3-methyl-5-hydroxy-6-metoxy-1,4-benzoquinol methylase